LVLSALSALLYAQEAKPALPAKPPSEQEAKPASPAKPPSEQAIRAFVEAKELISAREWQKAENKLNEVISLQAEGSAVDAALYYLAFVLKKQNKYREAEKAIERLLKEFPQSRWAGDAETLRMEVAPDVGKEKDVVDAARRSKNPEVRIAALQSLLNRDPQAAVAIIAGILGTDSDADKQMRLGSLAILNQVGQLDRRLISIVADLLRNESDVVIRKAAVNALRHNKEESVLNLLKDISMRSDTYEDASAALNVIFTQHFSKVRVFLLEAAVTARNMDVRRDAISKFALIGALKAGPDLLDIYRKNTETRVKQHALSKIGMIISPETRSILLEVIHSREDLELRKTAVMAFGKWNKIQSIELLSGLYDQENEIELKRAVLSALALSDKSEAVNKLMSVAQNDPEIELRKEAITQMSNSNNPEVKKFLERLQKQ